MGDRCGRPGNIGENLSSRGRTRYYNFGCMGLQVELQNGAIEIMWENSYHNFELLLAAYHLIWVKGPPNALATLKLRATKHALNISPFVWSKSEAVIMQTIKQLAIEMHGNF